MFRTLLLVLLALLASCNKGAASLQSEVDSGNNNLAYIGHYELGHLVLNAPFGGIDTEVWTDHLSLGWALRYHIPLVGPGLTSNLAEALDEVFKDACHRSYQELPMHRCFLFWQPGQNIEWIYGREVYDILLSIPAGEPIFVEMIP